MNPFQAVFLGILQGLTEFLPISSTAHLTLAGKVLGLIDPEHPESWTAFIAVMQLGTLAAVILYFRREIIAMTGSVFRDIASNGNGRGWKGYSDGSRLAFHIAIGTLPVGFLGFLFKHVIEGALTKTTIVIAASLVALAALLWVAEKMAQHIRTVRDVRWSDALLIGIAQALALIPGSSRSGTTMTAALFLGFTREDAARFSFLLSIPAVFASGIYEMTKIHGVADLGFTNLAIATAVSALSGYAAIAWLLKFLMKNTTMVFVWYRFALGFLLTLLLWRGVLQS